MRDLFTYGKLCPFFFDTGLRINLLFWPRFFHKVELRYSCWFRLLTFLIKAVTFCFFRLLGYLGVRGDCVPDRVLPILYSFACRLWGLFGGFK